MTSLPLRWRTWGGPILEGLSTNFPDNHTSIISHHISPPKLISFPSLPLGSGFLIPLTPSFPLLSTPLDFSAHIHFDPQRSQSQFPRLSLISHHISLPKLISFPSLSLAFSSPLHLAVPYFPLLSNFHLIFTNQSIHF